MKRYGIGNNICTSLSFIFVIMNNILLLISGIKWMITAINHLDNCVHDLSLFVLNLRLMDKGEDVQTTVVDPTRHRCLKKPFI